MKWWPRTLFDLPLKELQNTSQCFCHFPWYPFTKRRKSFDHAILSCERENCQWTLQSLTEASAASRSGSVSTQAQKGDRSRENEIDECYSSNPSCSHVLPLPNLCTTRVRTHLIDRPWSTYVMTSWKVTIEGQTLPEALRESLLLWFCSARELGEVWRQRTPAFGMHAKRVQGSRHNWFKNISCNVIFIELNAYHVMSIVRGVQGRVPIKGIDRTWILMSLGNEIPAITLSHASVLEHVRMWWSVTHLKMMVSTFTRKTIVVLMCVSMQGWHCSNKK